MSIFRKTTLACPACKTAVEFEEVHSVNADRRPDLRLTILDDTFQQQVCPKCGRQFRLDPDFNLMDTGRGQWIAAAPLTALQDWKAHEEHARSLFERAYGPEASELAQEIGSELKARLTFGWPALREKLLVSEHLLDDVALELCKAVIMRNSDSPVSAKTELRLIDVVEGDLIFAWMMSADESLGPTMRVARALYDEVAADADGDWEELKEDFTGALFVDLNRLMIPGEGPPKAVVAPSGFIAPVPEPAPEPDGEPAGQPEEEDDTESESETGSDDEPDDDDEGETGKNTAKKASKKGAAGSKKSAPKKSAPKKKK